MWTRSSYFLFFLFKYDAFIIKQPFSCSFGKKSRKIFENKKSPLSSPPHKFRKMLVLLGGTRQRRIRYSHYTFRNKKLLLSF